MKYPWDLDIFLLLKKKLIYLLGELHCHLLLFQWLGDISTSRRKCQTRHKLTITRKRRFPRIFGIIRNTKLLAGSTHDFRHFCIMTMIQSRKQMMLNLEIHSSPQLSNHTVY
jgi:hypothetical protein